MSAGISASDRVSFSHIDREHWEDNRWRGKPKYSICLLVKADTAFWLCKAEQVSCADFLNTFHLKGSNHWDGDVEWKVRCVELKHHIIATKKQPHHQVYCKYAQTNMATKH